MARLKLFVDDTRDFPTSGFECCRDVETAKMLISIFRDQLEFISLDYSMGNGTTCMDVLEYMFEQKVFPKRINIHSTHIYRDRMREYIEEKFPPDTIITMNWLDK